MKIRVSPGYTMLEVMIVLAVTSFLFVMVALTLQGRQARTEFSVAVREMESQIKDIINDVETGYYAGTENFSCRVGPTGLDLSMASPSERGENRDCIYLGRVIQFGITGDPDSYNIFSVAGARRAHRTTSGGQVVPVDNKNADVYPAAIPQVIPGATETRRYPVGLNFGGMAGNISIPGAPAITPNLSTVAFFSSLGSFLDKQLTGSLRTTVFGLPIDAEKKSLTPAEVEAAVLDIRNATTSEIAYASALVSSLDFCLNGEAVNQHAVYKIGGRVRSGEVEVIVGEGSCPSVYL